MNLLIVDDHPMTCAGLKSLLQTCYPLSRIDTLHSGEGVPAAAEQADYIFLDMHLPGTDFIRLLDTLSMHMPRVILISACPEAAMVVQARQRGARGLLLKNADVTHVLEGFRRIQAGDSVFDDASMGGQWSAPVLTERQRHVLDALMAGLSNKQIARELDISEYTVKEHVTAILASFGVRNRLELVLKQQGQAVF